MTATQRCLTFTNFGTVYTFLC